MFSILSLISNALAIIDHLWLSFNNSGEVKAKVAQMTQTELDSYNSTVYLAMNGTPTQKEAALLELRKLTSE